MLETVFGLTSVATHQRRVIAWVCAAASSARRRKTRRAVSVRLSSLHSHLVFWGSWSRAMTRVSFAAVPATDQVAAPAHTIAARATRSMQWRLGDAKKQPQDRVYRATDGGGAARLQHRSGRLRGSGRSRPGGESGRTARTDPGRPRDRGGHESRADRRGPQVRHRADHRRLPGGRGGTHQGVDRRRRRRNRDRRHRGRAGDRRRDGLGGQAG